MRKYIILFLLLLAWASPAWAVTVFVAPNGLDSRSYTQAQTSSTPWQTIQKCHNTALNGDICSVASGTYTPTTTCAAVPCVVNVTRAGITFKSTTPLGAKLVGGGGTTNFYGFFLASGGNSTTIQDFEISGFYKEGIHVANSQNVTNLTIRGNLIHDIGIVCTQIGFGIDGIFIGVTTSTILIENNVVHTIGRTMTGCTPVADQIRADHGIYIDGSTNLTMQRNLVYNMRNGFHVHLHPALSTNVKIYNNTFADPILLSSGQIIIAAPVNGLDITNNIFYNPSAASSPCGNPIGAIFFSGGSGGGALSGTVLVRNNLTNSSVWWYLGSCSSNDTPPPPTGVTTFTGNTKSAANYFTNAAARDYSLVSGSPAINTGIALTGITCTGTCDKGYVESGTFSDTTPPAAPTGVFVSKLEEAP
jgi:hypothetical protein